MVDPPVIDWDHLEAVNGRLNAFSHFDRAAVGDRSSSRGALAGTSIGIKANIAVRSLPFHAGLAAFEQRIARSDAATVAALREAGAAIIGITNMEEGALGAKTDNPHFGAVINPHRDGFSPGGSSGGSGAAVAAGLVDAALGTDTMGSVRIPAAHCGVFGFKPATHRVSQVGLEPADLSLDAIGPLARDLDLLEKVARVMSDFGEDALTGDGAVLCDHGVALHPAVAAAWDRARAALGTSSAEVRLDHPCGRIRFAGFIQVANTLSAHLDGVARSDRLSRLLAHGPARSEQDWADDQHILEQTRAEVRALITEHGFLLLPTVPNPPFPHSTREPAAQADFTCLANIAGLPALSLPAGWTDDGLPLGVQLISGQGAEAGLFALARHLDNRLCATRAPQPGDHL